ncbi:MAG: hypothetical protein ACKOKC_14005 [Chthoniobacterales bacterium]
MQRCLRDAVCQFVGVSTATLELVRICESLPVTKQAEVTDFARFLLERESDERWESIVAEGEPRPKFEAFLRDAASGEAAPLDPNRL